MAKRRVGQRLVAVCPFADREIPALALLALTADDREWDHNAVPNLQFALYRRADFDDLTHRLMAHDVARLHRRDEVIEEMQIRAANSTARHFDYSVAVTLDPRIGNRIAANITGPMPNEGSHWKSPESERKS